MQTSIELVAAAALCATGLSHWRGARAWAALFTRWAELGEAGALMNGMLHAGVGGAVVAAHPIFRGGAALLTIWALLVLAKGLIYLVFPSFGLRQMERMTPERAHGLRWIGLPMIALGVAIGSIAIA